VALTWAEVYIVSRARDEAGAAVPALALLEMLSTVIRAEADSTETGVSSRAAANDDSERRICARGAGCGAVGADTEFERRTHFRGDGIFSSVPALVMGGGLRRTGGSIVVGAFAGAEQRTRSLTVLDMPTRSDVPALMFLKIRPSMPMDIRRAAGAIAALKLSAVRTAAWRAAARR
jgi:hypothetical protein